MLHGPILLIDDNPEDLDLTQRLLVKAGISNPVVAVEGGEEGLVFLRDCLADGGAHLPDLIFCDVRMPGVNGFEVLKWVRENRALDKVFFAMHSGGAVPADRARAADMGAEQFLVKFPTAEELRQIMHQALTRGPKSTAPQRAQ